MGDDLHKSILESIQDKSDPTVCKEQLSHFYRRKQYNIQHKKYKLLIRWAHHAIASENIERVGYEATQKYAKWEYDMENAIKRYERLECDDGFNNAGPSQRPNTRAKEGGSLYVENTDLEPMSIIRRDDIEVYLRSVTYDQRVNALMSKFLARIKWLPLYRRFDIFIDAVDSFNNIREGNIVKQEHMLEKIRQKGEAIIPSDHQDQLDEFQEIMKAYFIYNYKNKETNKQDKILNTQKSEHQLAPVMINNILELKVNIVDKALEYGIYGDIELDQGYSFAYQITIFFPTYFQKQIIQSQFSLYDAFAGEEQDLNTVQKRNLINMVKIDTNIFKDISTTKNNVPSQEFLNTDPSFQDIKVTRMKSCSSWIDYVCVFPKVPAHSQKQAAILATDNPVDSLLRSAMNFLDVNDLATVNKILEETARLHQAQQKELAIESKLKAQNKVPANSGQPKANINDGPQNLKNHFTSAIKGEISSDKQDAPSKNAGPTLNNLSLKYLPQHLIAAFYVLRHMKSRDYKIKLLYCLNYFRSVQKRLMLDLREFGTRERIYGDQIQPYTAPTEASRAGQRNVSTQFSKSYKEQQKLNSISERMNKSQMNGGESQSVDGSASVSTSERQQSYLKQAEMQEQQEKIFNTINEEDSKEEENKPKANLYDMKQYKYQGKFCHKIYATCPVVPRFHATFGEPVEFQPINVEMERIGNAKHISDEGVKLLGRVDHIEITEKTREVAVKDDFGIYILYECAMQDMKDLEDEMLKIGSYYIAKHEFLVNTELEKAYPLVDRISLLEDLLDKELDFQFQKVNLVQCYIEAYEHMTDPLEQQRLVSVVVDLMAQRPRLNLSASYFVDSYEAEKQCLAKHADLMKTLIVNQMKLEKLENVKIQKYMDMTLRMTQEHEKGKWRYVDAEDFFNELKKRKEQRKSAMSVIDEQKRQSDARGAVSNLSLSNDNKTIDPIRDKSTTEQIVAEMSSTQKFLKNQVEKNHSSKYGKENQIEKEAANNPSTLTHKESEGGFAAVLGLPTITVETLYHQYKEKDDVILEIMNEQSNFTKLYEGYPDFLIDMQGLQSSKLSNYKFSDWSQPTNVLDFFESLSFAPKFYASIQASLSELQEVHKPHNSSLLAMIEFKLLERAEIEFQKVKAFYDGDVQEYQGQDVIEDMSIVGNPEKLIFHIKDLMSNLNKAQKQNLNPFLISKLDLETITFFDFQSIPKELNQYNRKQQNTVAQDYEIAVKIAESNTKQSNAAQSRYFSQLGQYMRKINAPCMLNMYCNTIELLRLRQELLQAISESMALQEIYEVQGKLVNSSNCKPFFSDSVKFDNYLIDSSKVNYIDDGPAANLDFDLAIKEFDGMLKSNLNFRNPDAVKMLICSSGLEELRGVLHYQLMHKQLLIIGVRMNQLVIDTHQRALSELELAKRGYGVPNSMIKVSNVFCKTGDGFSNEQYMKEKTRYMTNLQNNAPNVFYSLTIKKAKMRNTISKKFASHLQATTAIHRKLEPCLRIMRAYKVKLLHAYCMEILRDAYHDAVKIQAVASCQKLRTMAQIFSIDESVVGVMNFPNNREQAQVFKFEENEYFENIFYAYNQSLQQEAPKIKFSGPPGSHPPQLKALNIVKSEIIDYSVIPSTISLLKCDSLTQDELNRMVEQYPSPLDPKPKSNEKEDPLDLQRVLQKQQEEKDKQFEDCEKTIKEILPPVNFCEAEYPAAGDNDRSSLRVYDFHQSYDYSATAFGQIYSYYALLERIFKFEFSLTKINSSLLDTLSLEESVLNGLPFWSVDPELAVNKLKAQEQQQQLSQSQANSSRSSAVGNNNSPSGTQKLSEKVLEKIVQQKRAKINLAEEIVNFSNVIGLLLNKAQNIADIQTSGKTSIVYVPVHKINEFLISQQELRYYTLVHVIERLLETYYQKGAAKEVKLLTELHAQLTKRDHVKVSFKHNAFHVNGAYTRPDQYSLETMNLFSYYANHEDEVAFQSCVQPTINEKALSPPQITLLEGMYGGSLYKTTQYAGQIPHYPCVYPCLDAAFINMSDGERQYVNSTFHSVRILMKDYLEIIHKEKLNGESFEDGASIDQLHKCNKFLSDLIKARQLKAALMCWISSSTLPMDPQVYNQILSQYKNDIFWKIMNKKDSLPPISGKAPEPEPVVAGKGGKENDSALKKAEGSMIQNQQLMMMQAQVLVEQVQTCKAEIMVLSNELHRNIIKAAIEVIETETAALAGCFSLTAQPIEMHIHPFQQFASTLYSKVDPNSHLDMVTKLSEVQKFITKLQNRGTEVETLTSGPGMVFTIKDFNECIQMLCRNLIKYSELEMRARSENFAKKESHYINLLYSKDRKIENLEFRISKTQENLDKLINSKMYEKGNHLIYELDNVNRQLRLFKDNVHIMEKELNSKIRKEFQDSIWAQRREIEKVNQKFKEYRSVLTHDVNTFIGQNSEQIGKEIQKVSEDYKNKELGQPTDISSAQKRHQQRLERMAMRGFKPEGIMMEGTTSTKKSEIVSSYLDEINNMTEIEARQELSEMWKEMRTLRMFWKTKEVLRTEKYEREIFILKKQLTSNACLWEQLAESEKREKVLKQELVFTQQSLAASEKVIDKLKEDLRKSESDRIRLSQYKTTKAQRLEELESKVRKFEVMENINLEKLIDALGNKEKQITKLKDIERNFNEKLEVIEKKKDYEITTVKTQYFKELGMKKEVLERLEGLRMELRLLEKNEGSMTEVWKSKCKELVEICNKLKSENDQLRMKITQIAMNLSSFGGIGGNASEVDPNQQSTYRQSSYEGGMNPQFTLPKLMSNTQNKIVTNFKGSKYGGQSSIITATHTRQSSISKPLDSNMMSPQTGHDFNTSVAPSRSKEYSSASKQMRGRSTQEAVPNAANIQNNKVGGDQQLGKSYAMFSSNAPSTSKGQSFGVHGQPAQMNLNSKGFQSMRVSNGSTPKTFVQVDPQLGPATLRNSMNDGGNQNMFPNPIYKHPDSSENTDLRYKTGRGIDDEKPSTHYQRESVNENSSQPHLLQ